MAVCCSLPILTVATTSVMTQACHAATAALWETRHLSDTMAYVEDLPNMHKVVLEASGTKSLATLETVSERLKALDVQHYRWIEQPEDLLTCIATQPTRRSTIQDAIKKCQLWRS
ncbi:peptidyl-tRNA hydrolase II domain-containing protein [Syncephalis pseudoplumigaleata]|uniref:peptidyl-tRNA hydrolase n=1 Tax=Syncephalis pseudoplumigaleata TaxID=1712513 RepID=A0A4P9YWU3_9FUNG|nr:peptidyl-tRNA hydrolase II domain-containing protein [Syncephalis pseudoplumigaleata]|eukprot:RKP24338.1 peptidyl-tRNA hydrolase II domain-containing protein [Syncephalis pseudoplumigaleata]